MSNESNDKDASSGGNDNGGSGGPEDGRSVGPEDGRSVEPRRDHLPEGLELAKQIAKSTGNRPLRKKRSRGDFANPRARPRRGWASGPAPDDRDPQRLDNMLSKMVEDRGWSEDLEVHAVLARWPELVGSDIAAHSHAESYDGTTVVVRTDSTAWATQLRLLANQVVRRLNEQLGHGTVTRIEVRGPDAPSWKKGRLSTRDGRGPRDTYG